MSSRWLHALLFAFSAMVSGHAFSAQIVSFEPTGSVKAVQRVTARFSDDVVSMGDPRVKSEPFSMTCNTTAKTSVSETPRYSTRWVDSRSWILEFDEPLRAGVRCVLRLNTEMKDLSGSQLLGLTEYGFATSGPALREMIPDYEEIEPDQYFIALTDGTVDAKSVEAIAYFEVEGLPDKVKVRTVKGKDREIVLRTAIENSWKWSDYKNLLNRAQGKSLSQIRELDDFLVFGADRRFPESAKVTFHWPKGILSNSGVPVEDEQKFEFKVIEPFRARFSCERTAPDRGCNPLLDMRLSFSKRLSLKSLEDAKLVAEDGSIWHPEQLKKQEQKDDWTDTLTFSGPFPEATKFKLHLPTRNLSDELGRKLVNQKDFPLEVATDASSPLIKFPAAFGILELKSEPVLPVSVRNVEKRLAARQVAIEAKSLRLSDKADRSAIIQWYRAALDKEYDYESRNTPLIADNQGSKFQLPKPSAEKELELVGIPLKNPGFYIVEMKSPRLGEALTKNGPMYVATTALVTDMAVHFKKGRESSLVWVTKLSDGRPVGGARVSVVDVSGKELAKGTTNKDGILNLKSVKFPCALGTDDGSGGGSDENISDYSQCEVFVFASKDGDFSFASSNWSKGIEPYRFNVTTEYLPAQWGPASMHTVLDRMLAQPGDTVHMKHVLREYRERGFSMMNAKRLPKRVLIVHEGSNQTYTLPFSFDQKSGTALGSFAIPKDATLGKYTIYLSNRKEPTAETKEENSFDWSAQATGHFVVAEYRLPLMKASVKIQERPLVSVSGLKADLSAAYMAGGPAKGLKVKVRTSVQPGYFNPEIAGDTDYSFFSEPMKAGVFDSEARQSVEESFLKVQDTTLGDEGGTVVTVSGLPSVSKVQRVIVEMEYMDPSGEVKTASTQSPLFPADYAIGLRTDNWFTEPGKTKIAGVLTDLKGTPVAGRSYVVEAYQTNYITHRKRLVGGFYSYDSKYEVIALGKVCEGRSDEAGKFTCEPKNLPAGSITLQGKVLDDKGRASYAALGLSVSEPGQDSWWVPSDSDRIDLLPEKIRYEPGETAKLIIRSPYQRATVLVSVEREGVLDSFVTEVKRDHPVIEVPIKGNYAPNVFISALVLRGRVGEPRPTALIDLAKPSMKMGLTEVKVGWKANELKVSVQTDKDKYTAREKAQVTVQVKPALEGSRLPPGAEVAIVAVDESLLRLKENTSWKILTAMMGGRGLAVTTSSAQNQVVGRRHFGSKAKPPGGGGGADLGDTRELFEPVLIWEPRLKLNAKGEGRLTVPLNDSMTSFRIVAIATAGESFFGDGSRSIESSKDLILYSGFAPLVREGDRLANSFTVRNTTSKPMKLSFELSVSGLKEVPKPAAIELGPNEARTLEIPLTIPRGLKEIEVALRARDSLSGFEDALKTKIKVEPAVPARVLHATLFQLEKDHQLTVRQPSGAIFGEGGLDVEIRATLLASLGGVRSYMKDYMYTCYEQQISRGIVLGDDLGMKRLIEAMPSYLDSDGLLKFFPISHCGSVTLTSYVMNILSENNYLIPEATRSRLLEGLTGYIQGKTSCRSWWSEFSRDSYSDEIRVLALETLSRYKAFSKDLLSTVKPTPNLWKSETVIAWIKLLKREAGLPARDTPLKQAMSVLRSRVMLQGTMMSMQNTLDTEAQWRLFSSPDQEAIRAFGVALDDPSWSQDAGRMVRGIIARMHFGRWDTTMANAWGVTELKRFSARFEKEKVGGLTTVKAGEVESDVKWRTSPQGERKRLAWPKDSVKKDVLVRFAHQGEGKPWVSFETLSAIPLKAGLDMGYRISRKTTPVSQATPGKWRVGDVANIELTITAKSDQSWVVVRDPIPAGASHLGTGLEGASGLLNQSPGPIDSASDARYWPTEYEEKSHAYFITYAAYLPRGTYRLNYRVRLNSAGDFVLPPSRVEALYSRETFGEIPSANWQVAP